VDSIKVLGGGGALNSAVAMNRLGLQSFVMGEIGNDYAGTIIRHILKEEGVNDCYILNRENKYTSIVNVLITRDGDRSFICNPGNYINLSINDYNWDLLDNFDVILVGSCFILDGLLPDLPSLLQKCRDKNVLSIVDTVWLTRPNQHLIVPALPYIDYFTPSYEEAQVISGKKHIQDVINWFTDKGSQNIILKMDKNGSYIKTKTISEHIPAVPVELVDSTGAGDCFLAGFIKGLACGYNTVKCVQLGNAAGAMCVQKVGAYSGISNFDDLFNHYYSQYNKLTV